MKKVLTIIIVFALVMLTTGCTQPQKAEKVLKSQGYTNVKAGGYGFLACSDKDVYATKFTATTPNGTRVNGVVCKGLFKGYTIRFY